MSMMILAEWASKISFWWQGITTVELIWLGVGFAGQLMFSMRFILQWIASERARRSVLPEVFWYFSFMGGLTLFIYAIYKADPVFMLGQGIGLIIYSRNIYFIWANRAPLNERQVSKLATEQ